MKTIFRGVWEEHITPIRFVLGLVLLTLGEIVVFSPSGTDPSGNGFLGVPPSHMAGILFWNLLIILIFFHLPLRHELSYRVWIHATHFSLSNRMRHVTTLNSLGAITLQFLTERLDALNGVLYLLDEEQRLQWLSSLGAPPHKEIAKTLEPGEGILGQVAITRKPAHVTGQACAPLHVRAVLVESCPSEVIVIPLLHDDQLQGVLALGTKSPFQPRQLDFLNRAGETIARAITGVRDSSARQKLLEESRRKTEELAINQQVLRDTIQLLEQSSGFKSRFLANMSHELRSPLNSLLILAQLLKENRSGNLTPKQVEFASTIHAAGSDLLTLIDEILDLARIEAGRIRIFKDPVKLSELATSLERLFTQTARQKGLEFHVLMKGQLPLAIRADRIRVEQILKNLITNAIKFTHAGSVTVTFRMVNEAGKDCVCMSVADTGVGIPRDQHALVFEPFRQLDDGANRKYGGTGLGLAICKELAQLLNGRIELISEEGKGSLFSLILPFEAVESIPLILPDAQIDMRNRQVDAIPDDRRHLTPEDRAILLVGMDYHRIRALGDTARALGLGVIVAGDQSAALFLANFLRPTGLVMVGDLPGVATVPLIRRLRTTADHDAMPALYLHPANAPPLEDLSTERIVVTPLLRENELTDTESLQFLKSIYASPLAPSEPSPPPTLQEPHTATDDTGVAPTATRAAMRDLAGRRILLVDDDIRNVFALTSLLEDQGAQVIMAENGRVALELLREHLRIDMLLLDIMMPDMNGYDLLGEIRRQPEWRELPMLVLTAKAMQGERQRCLEAGASDYLSKPVDTQKLLSMMQPWLATNR
ncbi:Sensor histidine kinase RcsC [Candidatus Magnetaquicoccaceae bacterium FCR-1]|uniref:histidine kinase n=1 Tax=Candidatus Magnetaquiglobus chichijimensis TaxID=3141448 RepID=A0ABQ0C7M9_9PROT